MVIMLMSLFMDFLLSRHSSCHLSKLLRPLVFAAFFMISMSWALLIFISFHVSFLIILSYFLSVMILLFSLLSWPRSFVLSFMELIVINFFILMIIINIFVLVIIISGTCFLIFQFLFLGYDKGLDYNVRLIVKRFYTLVCQSWDYYLG